MKYFLQIVADDLKKRFGKELSRTIIVLPNKRASLFLNEHFAPTDDVPVWMPKYMTINELFSSMSSLTIADPIETICRLYRIYIKHTGGKETLDFFYSWGERLLADFDDVDKSMANAEKIFRDLRDYSEVGNFDVLSDEQVEQLKRFSADFATDHLTTIREKFNSLWSVILPIYNDLRAELQSQHMVYEGQAFRIVAEGLHNGTLAFPSHIDHIAFVGFNVIDKVEQTLFEVLQSQGKALFYWDYDTYYADLAGTKKMEAGLFLQENLQRFPNALSEADGTFTNFLTDRAHRQLEVIKAPTDMAQAQSISDWLRDARHFNPKEARRTAIVLCDENLLQPVIQSLPSNIGKANITKGFPLSHTPAFDCLKREMKAIESELDASAAAEYAKHKGQPSFTFTLPKGEACAPLLARLLDNEQKEAISICKQVQNNEVLKNLYAEAFFQVVMVLNRFTKLVNDQLLEVQQPTLFKLVLQVVKGISIPFHGEPAEGLQVMGVLETRCLDFDHIVMLSAGEGTIPQKASDASFIPALIRQEYGLTTSDKKVAVYAYYFHRLLQRATDVRMIYNESTDQGKKGDMSRFIKALMVERGDELHIQYGRITSKPKVVNPTNTSEKLQELAPASDQPLFKGLSPSALKTYFKCQLMFYYKYIKGLKTPQVQNDIINANDFGTVFHKAAETLYVKELAGTTRYITPDSINAFLEHNGKKRLGELTTEAFTECAIAPSEITHHAIVEYLYKLLRYEAGKAADKELQVKQFKVTSVEQEYRKVLQIPFRGSNVPFYLKGSVDRLDQATLPNGATCIRVIDYKTGKKSKNKESKLNWDKFFANDKNYPDNALQAFIYALMFTDKSEIVVPMLYYIPSMSDAQYTSMFDYDKNLAEQFKDSTVNDFRDIATDFQQELIAAIATLIDAEQPFYATDDKNCCKYCDFARLCGK